jgi:hypothetical protein
MFSRIFIVLIKKSGWINILDLVILAFIDSFLPKIPGN